MKFYDQDVSKTITARSLNLAQLIADRAGEGIREP